MKYPVDIDLLKRFIRNDCNARELEQIKLFLLDPAWREALSSLLDEQWQQFDTPEPDAAMVQEWKAAFEQRLQTLDPTPVIQTRRWRSRAWLAAACILPLLLGTVYFWQQQNDTKTTAPVAMKEIRNPKGRTAIITLSDSTVIMLGPGSRLQYPPSFSSHAREIILEGEAFFDVTRNPQQPFIVHTGAVQTRVLGTSFKITALPQQPIKVSVTTGKVQVQENNSLLALLTPGKALSYDPATAKFAQHDFRIAEVMDWKAGILSFNEVPFSEVAAGLERWFDVRISIHPPALGTKRMKLVVNGKKPLREAMETIRQITGLRYTIENKDIKIY